MLFTFHILKVKIKTGNTVPEGFSGAGGNPIRENKYQDTIPKKEWEEHD